MTISRAASYFISTPIYYVNSKPHIGHLYSSLLADAITRWQKIKHHSISNVIFSTGTDEHGLKIERAATASGRTPLEFCDEISGGEKNLKYFGYFWYRKRNLLLTETFRTMFNQFSIEYTNYIRTTDSKHHRAVHYVWQELLKQSLIYKGSYEGWYSIQDECFVTEDQVRIRLILISSVSAT